jgi:serine/threonine protein kinase
MRETDRLSVTAHTGKDRENFQFGLQAFLEEARTVAKLVHPNIVRVKTYLEQNHTAYLVMEYYEGLSVAEYVRQQGGRIPEKSAVGIMQFVLDGLRHVHENGYLHRDVKPANIYMTKRGQVILRILGLHGVRSGNTAEVCPWLCRLDIRHLSSIAATENRGRGRMSMHAGRHCTIW